jgi:exodeoxyribonuclease VII small subunit
MTKDKTKPPQEMTYEEAFQELKEIVARLEASELQLEESMSLFERGQALTNRCSQLLDEAELKLQQLTSNESGNSVQTDLKLEGE